MDNNNRMKVVFTVTERGGKSYWSRVGVCLPNKDGSWNWKLDAIPVNGSTIQLREFEPKDDFKTGDPTANGRRARDVEAPLA